MTSIYDEAPVDGSVVHTEVIHRDYRNPDRPPTDVFWIRSDRDEGEPLRGGDWYELTGYPVQCRNCHHRVGEENGLARHPVSWPEVLCMDEVPEDRPVVNWTVYVPAT